MTSEEVLDHYRLTRVWSHTAEHFGISVKMVKQKVKRASGLEAYHAKQRQLNRSK